jgi:hypothetical protein
MEWNQCVLLSKVSETSFPSDKDSSIKELSRHEMKPVCVAIQGLGFWDFLPFTDKDSSMKELTRHGMKPVCIAIQGIWDLFPFTD